MAQTGQIDKPTPDTRRILEIGETGLFYWAMQAQTDALYASYRADLRQGRNYLGLASLFRAFRAVRRGHYDLVVVHPPFYAGWHWRSFLAALKFTLLKGRPRELYGALTSPLVFALLRFLPKCRLIAIDRADSFGMPGHHIFWLDKADAYLKRELPLDHWQVFYGSAHRRLPGRTFRLKKRWLRRIAKIRPIALGLPGRQVDAAQAAYPSDKSADVFFAGTTDGNSTVRSEAPALLAELAQAGIKVDVPDGPLPLDAFMRRCASAWITLSPEGLGWDCFRHAEAAIAGSVPLVSAPTIDRSYPMIIGKHCLCYYPDEKSIVGIVKDALADKDRLRDMARASRNHALNHLTEEAICADLIATYARR